MNYKHIFHAGNHADIFKHFSLSLIAKHFSQKEAPFAFIDSHSGEAIYQLEENTKTTETSTGLHIILNKQADAPQIMQEFIEICQSNFNNHQYFGSPFYVIKEFREFDKVYLNDLHPEIYEKLKINSKKFIREFSLSARQISISNKNAYELPKSLIPTQQKRLIMLIDAPFEKDNDFTESIKTAKDALQKMRQACIIIWYPIKHKRDLQNFYQTLKKEIDTEILQVDLCIQKADNSLQLNGSGLIILNAPYQFIDKLKPAMNFFAAQFQNGSFNYQILK